jgi:hypothetical protein
MLTSFGLEELGLGDGHMALWVCDIMLSFAQQTSVL